MQNADIRIKILKLVKISRQIKELIFQNIIHHSSFLPRAPALPPLPRTCHSRANAKNLVRHASVIITNASSVCLRQPPSPTGEGKLKRHCSAYNWLPCLTQSLKRALLISGNPWGRSSAAGGEGLFCRENLLLQSLRLASQATSLYTRRGIGLCEFHNVKFQLFISVATSLLLPASLPASSAVRCTLHRYRDALAERSALAR